MLLEACRNHPGAEAIVVASSDKAYGSHRQLPYRETAPLCGKHPYDVSKSCADLITATSAYTYGLPAAITRCGNIYGPGDFHFSRIVPDAVRCALSGKPLAIRSDGKFTRDYVYVTDIAEGYILLAEQLKKKKLSGEAFNFSDENPKTVIELVRSIARYLNRKPNFKILNQARYEIKHQYLASDKARDILKWKPRNTLESGLQTTIQWYKDYFDRRGTL